jgi:DNA-binding transcriptional regulator GbsR (MarR family)
MELTPSRRRFVLHWGEMGTRWAINRTVAQVYALLFVSERPLHAGEIAETLEIARSNVSVSVHVLGDRRDYFESLGDVWAMTQAIFEQRRRREIDPTVAALRECIAEAAAAKDTHARERLAEMLDFFELTLSWFDQVRRMPRQTLTRFTRMGSRVAKFLEPAS